AKSAAQATATASASVLVTPATISVSISPLNVSLQVGQSQQFSATVSGSGNTSINWLVSGVAGGNSSVGKISTTGLFNAPSTVPSGSVVVTAQSAANPNSSASTPVSISQPVAHSVQLSWNDSGSNLAGYNIYRASNAAGPFSKLNSSVDTATVFTDTTV